MDGAATHETGMDYVEMGEAAYDYSEIDYDLDYSDIRKRHQRTADTSTTGEHGSGCEDPTPETHRDNGRADA